MFKLLKTRCFIQVPEHELVEIDANELKYSIRKKNSQCILFRDLVQTTLKQVRLQFGEKPKMQVDENPLKVEEDIYAEPLDYTMIKVTEDFDIEVMMVGTTEVSDEKMKSELQAVYPHPEEILVDLQEKCRVKGSRTKLYP